MSYFWCHNCIYFSVCLDVYFISTGESKADAARRKREERKAQRQKELEEKRAARQAGGSKGAMKLGVKKLATD